MVIKRRLREYSRITLSITTYAILGLVWLAVFRQFFYVMWPRINHISASGMHIIDRPCGSPECDFSVFWPAGLLGRAGQFGDLYSPVSFLIMRQHIFLLKIDQLDWFYPPTALLPFMAVSYLPFEFAFMVWSIGGIAFATILLRRADLPWIVITIALLSPAALWNFELGQFGTVIGGIMVSGLLMSDETAWLAGVILGLLVLKPQTGLLVPVALLAKLNWRAVIGGFLMTAVLIVGTTILLGWSVWGVYLGKGMVLSKDILNEPFEQNGYMKFGVSVFWMMRSFGSGLFVSYVAQGFTALIAVLVTWQIHQQTHIDRIDRVALIVFLSLLVTPYGYTDDMVAYSIVLAMQAQRRGWQINLLDVLFWLWPMLCPIVVMKTGILLTPFIVTMAIARTWTQAERGGRNLANMAMPAPISAD